MVKTSVVIPWRPGEPDRERNLAWILWRWEETHPSWEVIVAPDDAGGPWRKGVAAARGIGLSRGDVIVLGDADCWAPDVAQAVEKVRAGARWYMPHTNTIRLTAQATKDVLGGASLEAVAGKRAARELTYCQATAGGMVVLRRDVAVDVPIDPRFAEWGGEDLAHRYALEVLAGRRKRLPGYLYHLHHAPAHGRVRGHLSPESDRLRIRYAKARIGDGSAMRKLVAEAKAWLEEARAA